MPTTTRPPRRPAPASSRDVSETRFDAARLYPTKNDLPEAARREAIGLLNQRLADCIDLQTQCKQAHWNVKGPTFIALHKLFDEVNEAGRNTWTCSPSGSCSSGASPREPRE